MLTNIQQKAITHFEENRFSIIMHSRQTGVWAAAASYAVNYALSNPKKTIMVTAPKSHITNEVFNASVKVAKENNKYDISKLSEKSIVFNNNSKIIKSVMHKNNDYNSDIDMFVVIDFACCIPSVAERFYTNVMSKTLEKSDSRIVICSNPNGYNLFYKIFQAAEQENNLFKALRVYYWMSDRLHVTDDWIKQKIEDYGEDGFNEQFNLCYKMK